MGLFKKKKPKAAEQPPADFTVLMLGQRRTGKSSVLSSMITSMEKICSETGFRFVADDDTKIFIKYRRSQLEQIFHVHAEESEFTTMEGMASGGQYSIATDADITYRFTLEMLDGGQAKKPAKENKNKQSIMVDFIDVRGESMFEEFSSINDTIARSSVLMIAIDSPALMEGKLKDGAGEYHKNVNLPEDIYNHITTADAQMREHLKKKQTVLPRLVLFVPLKCEKYYYGNRMGELNERIRAGYRNLFTFFENTKEYTVAITPILTLGDVVFDHYKMRTIQLPNGNTRQVPIVFGDEGSPSMRTVPKFPMFRFRDVQQPKFSPQYCEQPLVYLLSYIIRMSDIGEKKGGDGFARAAVIFWFGLPGLLLYTMGKGVFDMLAKNANLKKKLQRIASTLKISGDGYEIVYDRMGLGKGLVK